MSIVGYRFEERQDLFRGSNKFVCVLRRDLGSSDGHFVEKPFFRYELESYLRQAEDAFNRSRLFKPDKPVTDRVKDLISELDILRRALDEWPAEEGV